MTIYARREPTTDRYVGTHFGKMDVVLYENSGGTAPIGRFPWFVRKGFNKRSKRIALGGAVRPLIWLPDLAG